MIPERTAEVERLCSYVARWAEVQPDIVSVALVGSWARDEATMTSDVDVVVLTTDTARYLEDTEWIDDLGTPGSKPALVATRHWGSITERRIRLASGLEVEFGFGQPPWATTTPIDAGTRRVVVGGCRVLFDRGKTLERRLASI